MNIKITDEAIELLNKRLDKKTDGDMTIRILLKGMG